MVNIFEVRDKAILLIVDKCGQREYVQDDEPRFIYDLYGSTVKIQRFSSHLLCEAKVPESKTPVVFRFSVDETGVFPVFLPIAHENASDLRELVWNTRVALNGKL